MQGGTIDGLTDHFEGGGVVVVASLLGDLLSDEIRVKRTRGH